MDAHLFRRSRSGGLGIGGEQILRALGFAIHTGDASGDQAELLHALLENEVLPLYHGNRVRRVWMMKQAISKIGPYFNSQRMMRRYATEAYLR